MKIEHHFFKFYHYRLLTYKSNRYNEDCNKVEKFNYLHLNCDHFVNERKKMNKDIKIFVTIGTLLNISESIKNVFNLIKNFRICKRK